MDEQIILDLDNGSAGRPIRREWHNGRWFFAVVDVIAVLTDSAAPTQYWRDMKRRMSGDGWDETQANILPLKMRALDGKRRDTDAADVETMLRIVQAIPSPKAEPVRLWLAQVGAQRLEEAAAELDEGQRRLLLRGEVATQNKSLAATAQGAGVATGRDFAVFQDWGYKGLYDGETAADIAERKGLGKRDSILDHMGSTELAANLFRITQTGDRLRQMQEQGEVSKGQANATHYEVGKIVRGAIEQIGGTMPEDLPTPPESIAELERREQQRALDRLQPRLFSDQDS